MRCKAGAGAVERLGAMLLNILLDSFDNNAIHGIAVGLTEALKYFFRSFISMSRDKDNL